MYADSQLFNRESFSRRQFGSRPQLDAFFFQIPKKVSLQVAERWVS